MAANQPEEKILLSPHVWDKDTFEYLKWLRKNDPVHWSEKEGAAATPKQKGIWLVTTFNDVAAVSKNQNVFSSAPSVLPALPVKLGLIDDAPPEHKKLRQFMSRGFTPNQTKELEKKFRKYAKEAVDRVAKTGECDIVKDIATPLPINLIADMIGVPEEDRSDLQRWSDDMLAPNGRMDDMEIGQRAQTAFIEFTQYMQKLIDERRKNPKNDLVSVLVAKKDAGVFKDFDLKDLRSRVPIDELEIDENLLNASRDKTLKMLGLLLIAGNETTRSAISGGVELLANNPDQLQKLVDNPALIPAAVEEVLRLTSPVQTFARTVTQDTELHGKNLKKGDTVLLVYPSANRDEHEFKNPEQFDVTRKPRHLAFGIGNHFCLGANLARMELRVVFNEIVTRMKDLQLEQDGIEMDGAPLVRTYTKMKVKFTPEK